MMMAKRVPPSSKDWREAVVRLMSSPDEGDWERARELKLSKMPAHLFRYRPPTKYSFDGLIRQSVWLSPASEFNDLFDASAGVDAHRLLNHFAQKDVAEGTLRLPAEVMAELPPDGEGFIEAMDAAFVKVLKKQHGAETAKKAQGFFANFTRKQGMQMAARLSTFTQRATKVACFCEVGDDVRMWAHYTDNHRGFCVEYPFDTLPRDDLRLRWTMPVIYRSTPFDLAELLTRVGRTPNPWTAYLIAMHKLSKWDYEREWRMIDTVGDNVSAREIVLPTPSRILLGHRMSGEHRTLIESIAKEQGIELLEMVRADEGFALASRAVATSAPR